MPLTRPVGCPQPLREVLMQHHVLIGLLVLDVILGALCLRFHARLRAMRRAAERHVENIEAAQAATQAKNDFLANISHEIRTPMTAILGFADLLLEQGLSPSGRLDYIQIIRRNGEHLLSLINDILDLSKIEEGKMQI